MKGYALTITGWLGADPAEPAEMKAALEKLERIAALLDEIGVDDLELRQRYVARRADPPAAGAPAGAAPDAGAPLDVAETI